MNQLEGLKKVDALKRLKKKVLKYGVIGYQYVGKNPAGKRCHCAVGHLMSLCGVDMAEVGMVYNSDNVTVFEQTAGNKLIQPMLEVGFHMGDLRRLQVVNDDGSRFTRKADVLEVIDEMIEELELEAND